MGTPLGCVLSVKWVPFPVLAEPGEVGWWLLWMVQGSPLGGGEKSGGSRSGRQGRCQVLLQRATFLQVQGRGRPASSSQVSECTASPAWPLQLGLSPGPRLRPSTRSPGAGAARMKYHKQGSNDRYLLSLRSGGWKFNIRVSASPAPLSCARRQCILAVFMWLFLRACPCPDPLL